MIRAGAGLAALAGLAGCAAATAPAGGGCPVSDSKNWAAWINAMPGPGAGRPRLIVKGEVTVPTGGWTLALEQGPLAESDPPVQTMELRAEAPSGMATQAIVTQEVRAELPALPRYGSVVIRCGAETLATISPVETVY